MTDFSTVGVNQQWHRMLREVAGSPSLAILKIHLDVALSNPTLL